MQHKSCKAEFKALDDSTGTFEAIVSVFGNVDKVNDRVVKGAFASSIKKWKESGDPIPVIWSHQWDDPDAHIGKTLEAEENDTGLYVKGQLDLDDPFAAKVYKLLKERRVKEFSFAYDTIDEKSTKDGINELLELDVIEVGPTLKGANPETQLIGAKGLAVFKETDEGWQPATQSEITVSEAKSLVDSLGLKTEPPKPSPQPDPPVETKGRVLSSDDEQVLKKAQEIIGKLFTEDKPDEPKAIARDRSDDIARVKSPLSLLVELEALEAVV